MHPPGMPHGPPLAGTPPPPPPPRQVALFPHAKGLFLWVGLAALAFVCGAGMTGALTPYLIDHAILDQRGVKTTGKPVKVSAYQQHSAIYHRIVVRFSDRKGKKHRAILRTQDRAIISRAEAKQPFRVVYDPENPSRNRFPADVRLHWSIALTPMPFAIGGLIALLMGWSRLRRRKRLVTHGHAAQGVVTTIERISASRSDNVVYQFATVEGWAYGCWTTQSPPSVGLPIWVLYDPKEPAHNTVWNG